MKKIISFLLTLAMATSAIGIVTVSAADTGNLQIETRFYEDGDIYTFSIITDETKTVKLLDAQYRDSKLIGTDLSDHELTKNLTEYFRTYAYGGIGGGSIRPDKHKYFIIDNGKFTPVTAYRNGRTYEYNSGDVREAEVTISNISNDTTYAKIMVIDDSGNDISSSRIYTVSPQTTIAFYHGFYAPDNSEYAHVIVEEYASADAKTPIYTYDGGYITRADVEFPETAPFEAEHDSTPTFGAHDPTIFKNPADGKYYAYSSHNLIFVSEDLINWEKYNFTTNPENNTGIEITVPKSSADFIAENYPGTAVNGTYWAPDILYKENDEYPYWFYTSVSCGLGGRNSVIDLVKAKSPLVWDDEYLDCGVVLASREEGVYHTNAIDEHIYTDTDGKTYFIWGSFWQGIHAAELNDNGTIAFIDGTASGDGKDKTIKTLPGVEMLEASKNFGTRVFSAPSGVFGPEGPWMVYNEDTGYRYMFTSYGWLGTNYNIRVARTDKTMAEVLYGEFPAIELLDYQNRPVGIAYDGQEDKTELWGYKMLGSCQLGDGIT